MNENGNENVLQLITCLAGFASIFLKFDYFEKYIFEMYIFGKKSFSNYIIFWILLSDKNLCFRIGFSPKYNTQIEHGFFIELSVCVWKGGAAMSVWKCWDINF